MKDGILLIIDGVGYWIPAANAARLERQAQRVMLLGALNKLLIHRSHRATEGAVHFKPHDRPARTDAC